MLYYDDLQKILKEIEIVGNETRDIIMDELFRNIDMQNELKQTYDQIDKLKDIISILQETIKNLTNKGK